VPTPRLGARARVRVRALDAHGHGGSSAVWRRSPSCSDPSDLISDAMASPGASPWTQLAHRGQSFNPSLEKRHLCHARQGPLDALNSVQTELAGIDIDPEVSRTNSGGPKYRSASYAL
jgi:hypothetical protein